MANEPMTLLICTHNRGARIRETLDAADSMIPSEAFIRLPDLGESRVETFREVLARPGLWAELLGAIDEARRLILNDLNLITWAGAALAGHGAGQAADEISQGHGSGPSVGK